MNDLMQHLPALQVLIPMSAALVAALVRQGSVAWIISLLATWASLIVSVLLLQQVLAAPGPISYVFGGWTVPVGIEYRVDRLNVFVLLVVNLIAAVLLPYAARSVASEVRADQRGWFYAMFLLCLTGLLGMGISGDAFNIFVFLEISSLSSYVLIAMGRHRRALLASYQYLIIGTIGATFYVIGVGLMYLSTGSLNLADIGARLDLASTDYGSPLLVALAFLTVGISLKAALFPLHVWLPNAYGYAPTVVGAFMAGTATKVAIYLLIRIYYSVYGPVFGVDLLPADEILIVMSLAAMILASFSAIFQDNARRMLAYSSVAQIGYITLGVALVNQSGLTGGIVHVMNHAVIKTALFMALGAIYFRIGSVRFADMAGIGRRMPITMAAFMVAGMGLIGVPGTAGFISKWYLAVGAIDAGLWPIAFVIVATSVLAMVYVGKVIEVAYFRAPSGAADDARDPPLSMLVPMLALVALSVWLGFDTRFSADLASGAAQVLLEGIR